MHQDLKTASTVIPPIRNTAEHSATPSPFHLTNREKQVLILIAMGKTSRQIAALLRMSFHTAVSHRYHIQQKFGLHSTADLTRAAIRMGLIEA